jgi:MoxR-like ATPase
MMAKITEGQKTVFEDKLFSKYPDVKTSGVVSRKQLLEIREEMGNQFHPLWLMATAVGRGLYAIPGGSMTSPLAEPANDSPTPKQSKHKAEAVSVDFTNTESLIPKIDANYVPFGNYKDLEQIVVSKQFYPAYVSGPTGNGKSTSIEQICAKHRRPLIRINLNSQTDEDQLVGTKTLIDGNVEIVEGPVVIAMRLGIPLLLDEIDAGSANALLCLQPILEGKPFYYKLKNEMIYPALGFNMFATANTKGKGSDDGRYIGTNVLNEAFLERFAVTFNQEYPDAKVEMKIVMNLMKSYGCVDEKFADTMVKWADAIRRTFDSGGVDETITTRRLIHIVRAFSIFKNQKKAIELCTNRFDDATRLAFVDLFDKVSSGEVAVEETPASQVIDNEIPF